VIPNPARAGRATVAYSLAKAGPVDVSIYSVDGRRVKTLAHGTQEAGRYQVRWDGSDDRGTTLRAGTYFVRLQAADVTRTHRVTLVP
jgi:flagellar hook assembly protein FlgD